MMNRRGARISLYAVERASGLPYSRLTTHLSKLRAAGLVENGLGITLKGYEFLEDIVGKVAPLLAKYDLWNESGTVQQEE